MPLSISIRFLTGRAHLHPWQTHHSEGRVEWPPSHWRLLRAFVAIAGRGLTSFPMPDFVVDPGKKPKPTKKNPNPVWPPEGYTSLPDQWHGEGVDEIPHSRLAGLLATLAATPSIWLPKTAGGHTRQYFPIHDAGIVKNSGSAVFDTFATLRKDQPLVFHWPNVDLEAQSLTDLKLLLARLTYFGRAESWCRSDLHVSELKELPDVVPQGDRQTHWECVCIEDGGKPVGKEYRDYTLERRLAPCGDVKSETVSLLPRTKIIATDSRPKAEDDFRAILNAERTEVSLLRCLLRESGQDIKDGLERPIGTRWVHYAVPRAIYDVPRPSPQPKLRNPEAVDLVVYALNTATVHRPVLPALTDTLLVADRFRSAVLAVYGEMFGRRQRKKGEPYPRVLCGHEEDGTPCKDHKHAFWWPTDEDNDGFLDHVTVYACDGFEGDEVDALRRLSRIRQRGGRPDLLVTPIYVGSAKDYQPWQAFENVDHEKIDQRTPRFVSATPYFCPLPMSRGRNTRASRPHSIKKDVRKRLRQQHLIGPDDEVDIQELVFDYAPSELQEVQLAIKKGEVSPPVPPRQYFPVIEPPLLYPTLAKPTSQAVSSTRYPHAAQKDPDEGFAFGLSNGLYVDGGTRFIRALAFCRRRRNHHVRGMGRMFSIRFSDPRPRRPFAIGDQCHYGLGLFVPE